jgi:hypothetical protein
LVDGQGAHLPHEAGKTKLTDERKLQTREYQTRSVSGGDYLPGDLERAVDNRYLMANVAAEALRLAESRSKVIFAGSVLHSQKLTAAF